ncbi:SRPBCC domain-containing protein [Mycobacteriaceae bacterium NPDC060252]
MGRLFAHSASRVWSTVTSRSYPLFSHDPGPGIPTAETGRSFRVKTFPALTAEYSITADCEFLRVGPEKFLIFQLTTVDCHPCTFTAEWTFSSHGNKTRLLCRYSGFQTNHIHDMHIREIMVRGTRAALKGLTDALDVPPH